MKKKVTKKQLEEYNKIVSVLNETEEFQEDRIKCIRIVNGYIEYFNCKTGEKIP